MVRRWSYINSIITLPSTYTTLLSDFTSDILINNTMYLRKSYPIISLNHRKRWARRKYTHDILYLSNLLVNWAYEYRFYKIYNRSLIYQYFFLASFLTLYTLPFKKTFLTPLSYNHFSLSMTLGNKTIHYFSQRFNYYPNKFLLMYRNAQWAVISSNSTDFDKTMSFGNLHHLPYLIQTPTTLISHHLSLLNHSPRFDIMNTILKMILQIILEYYKIYVKSLAVFCYQIK